MNDTTTCSECGKPCILFNFRITSGKPICFTCADGRGPMCNDDKPEMVQCVGGPFDGEEVADMGAHKVSLPGKDGVRYVYEFVRALNGEMRARYDGPDNGRIVK